MNYIDAAARHIFHLLHPGEPSAQDLPLYRIYAVLALAKGEAVTCRDVHDAWAAWTAEQRPEHPSLVPFEQLPSDIQDMDQPYVKAIHTLARLRRGVITA